MIILVAVQNFRSHHEWGAESGGCQLALLEFPSEAQISDFYLERSRLLVTAWHNVNSANELREVPGGREDVFLCQVREVHQNVVEFQVTVNHILGFDCHQTLDELLQDKASFDLGKVALSSLEKAVNIATVAVLHHEIVIRLRFGARNQGDYVFVLNFCHYFNLVDQKLMVLSADALPVDDLHGVDLVGVIFQIPEVYRAVLALAQHLGCQDYLNLVSWEGDNFAARLQLLVAHHFIFAFLITDKD